jgi:hypothetical protein
MAIGGAALEPHLQDSLKLSTDPFFVEKVVDVVGLYHNPPERVVVLCVDEKSQIQALDRSQPVLPMMPGMPERRTHDHLRHGITSVFTPIGSSWMNQVERWFGLLTDKLIRRGVHTSVQAWKTTSGNGSPLERHPRPFTWTKTADEILASLADYLAKVRAGHHETSNANQQNL